MPATFQSRSEAEAAASADEVVACTIRAGKVHNWFLVPRPLAEDAHAADEAGGEAMTRHEAAEALAFEAFHGKPMDAYQRHILDIAKRGVAARAVA